MQFDAFSVLFHFIFYAINFLSAAGFSTIFLCPALIITPVYNLYVGKKGFPVEGLWYYYYYYVFDSLDLTINGIKT